MNFPLPNFLFLSLCYLFLPLAPAAIAIQSTGTSAAIEFAKSEGALDEFQISGNTLKARGWAGADNSANPVTGIHLLLDGVDIYNGGFEKQERPDVARAKGRPDWLDSGWLIEAPFLNPPPDGPRKISAAALLKNGERFDLRVPEGLVPVLSSTPPTSQELLGHLDEVVLEGDRLKVRGWAASPDPSQKIQAILLKSGDEILYRGKFEIEERPDVATALGKLDLVNSGWIVRLDWSGKPAPSSLTPQFEMETGEIIPLPVPVAEPSQTPTAASATQANTILTRTAWLAAVLLAGLAGWMAYQKFRQPRSPCSVEPVALASFQRPDRANILVLAGVFFSIFASKLFLIAHFGSGIPFWDQWASEGRNLLIPYLEGRLSLSDLFSPHNEHRIALSRLLMLGLFVLNGQWDPLASMSVQAALHAGILTFLVAVLRSGMDSKCWGLFAAFTALFCVVPFSWENTLWGFQSCFYFVLLAGLVGIWFTLKCVELSLGWWFGWAMLLAGLFALGSGFLASVAVLAVGSVRVVMCPAPKKRALTGLVAVLFLVILAVGLMVKVPRHDYLKAQNFANFFDFFLKLAAWPTEIPWLGLVLQLPVLGIGLFVLVRRPPRHDPAWFMAALGFWNALSMAATAYGRANGGLASRYTDSLAFGMIVS